jgi:hypothetical protein
MTLDQKRLEKLLNEKDSEKKIVEFFRGASEQERRQLSGFCVQNLKDQIKAEREAWRVEKKFENNPLIWPATYAAYCTSTPSQFDQGWRTHISGELVYELLADRRPDWIDEWVQRCCQQLRVRNYPEIRRLSREGLCAAPSDDNFVRMMITRISWDNKTPLAGLQQDPDLLNDLVYGPEAASVACRADACWRLDRSRRAGRPFEEGEK